MSLFLKLNYSTKSDLYSIFYIPSTEKEMSTHSSTLAWKIPWTEEPGRLQSMRSLGVGHDWATSLSLFTFMHWRRKWQPTPVFLPAESQGWGSLVGCRNGVAQSRTQLKWLSSSSISQTQFFCCFFLVEGGIFRWIIEPLFQETHSQWRRLIKHVDFLVLIALETAPLDFWNSGCRNHKLVSEPLWFWFALLILFQIFYPW